MVEIGQNSMSDLLTAQRMAGFRAEGFVDFCAQGMDGFPVQRLVSFCAEFVRIRMHLLSLVSGLRHVSFTDPF